MEKKPTMEMTIRKGAQSQTVKLPCDFLTLKVALYQLDVLKGPEEVTVEDVGATFQSEDELGQKIVDMLQSMDSLVDVDIALHLVWAAPKPIREALSQMTLEDAVGNIVDIAIQRDALVEQLGEHRACYYFPLTCTIEDEEYDYAPVEGYPGDMLRNMDAIQTAIQREQAYLIDTMAMHFWTRDPALTESIQEKLLSCIWDVEVVNDRLYGKVDVVSTEQFAPLEEQAMKDWILGQNSDGLGEGFEQRPIETEWGDLYVHFWNSGDDYEIVTAEEMKRNQSFDMEMG